MYPEFHQDIEYTELRGGVYRFKLLQPISVRIDQLKNYKHFISFRDGKNVEWAHIYRDLLSISKDYAWNGASPKWWVPLLGWVGTPDPEATRMATLVHDVLYQFINTEHFPLNVEESNMIFYQIMRAHDFRFSNTYFGAVQDFGKRFADDPPKNGEHSVMVA